MLEGIGAAKIYVLVVSQMGSFVYVSVNIAVIPAKFWSGSAMFDPIMYP